MHVGAEGYEELSRVRKQDGSRTVLRVRSVRNELKDICRRNTHLESGASLICAHRVSPWTTAGTGGITRRGQGLMN